ncbi:RHS repeat-associated core domain-containing protein [Micromonospora chalcea]|uniref:RHS repeat-associated core domain-containing protein n=1 Tax=Micromonospora chalcea TaxID=1874 RepID=UPI002167CEEA|nr:RHS repeat-associated core domain-containing protein [Micromonospora chalcea]
MSDIDDPCGHLIRTQVGTRMLRHGGSRLFTGRRRLVTSAVTAIVAAGVLVGTPAAAAPTVARPPVPSPGRSVDGVKPLPSRFVTPRNDARTSFKPTRTTWPRAAAAQVDLSGVAKTSSGASKARAAGTPVWVSPVAEGRAAYTGPQRLDVRVLDRAAATATGVDGLLVGVTPQANSSAKATGTVRIGVDYDSFAEAYGGNYGLRLKLVRLPACALDTPQRAECRKQLLLPSTNDTSTRTVSAEIPVETAVSRTGAQMLVAAVAGAGEEGGKGGTYAATDLKPSGSWSAGGSTGSFSYSYPLTLPPSRSKLAPQIALSYDSSAVDGQTVATNAQASWVGDGWSTPRNYVEQTFVSCKDNPGGSPSPKKTYDRCYAGPILTLSLNGSSTSLIWDVNKKVWKLQSDNGSVVTRVTGSNNGSGTYNTEYWRVTEPDGTIYEFGRNRLPGWSSDKPETKSVDYGPVYSPHSDDPCYDSAGFDASVCTMAHRWNLDYVKDPHGNAMAYFYNQDVNYYGRNEGATDVPYIRDSSLARVDYGFSDGGAYGTVPNRVVFNTDDRCLSGTCKPLNESTKANWPDVPYDLICAKGTDCKSWSPSFFSTVRLTSIQTQQYDLTARKHLPVDTYTLAQTMPATGDGTSPTLWLDSITRTGHDLTSGGSTTPITLPSVSFTGKKLANRVDTAGGFPSFYRQRIETVTTETGSKITASYELPVPCSAPVTVAPESNTRSCYPVYWTPDGLTTPKLDWFHKYAVTRVTATDPTGGALQTSTSYKYVGGAAWRYDDNEVVKAKYRTYGQFRGYGKVETRNGDGVNDAQTLSVSTYYRGMSKNNNSTVVRVTDSAGGQHEDLDQLAGRELETTTHRGDTGPVETSSVMSYWVSGATATRERVGLPALTAHKMGQVQKWNRQAVTSSGTTTWRYSQTDTTYDTNVNSPTFGLITHTYDHTVPVNSAYDRCTSTKYAPVNTTKNITGLISQVETVSVACGGYSQGSPATVPGSVNTLTAPTNVDRPRQVVSHTRTYYDDPEFDETFPQTKVPTWGTVTMVRKAEDYKSGAYVYQTSDRAEFDSYGRAVATYDANGNVSRTTYTDNSVGLTVAVKTTNAAGHSTSTMVTPMRNLTTVSSDVNDVVTTRQYDALGRVKAVWAASRATSSSPHYRYTYLVQKTGPSATTLETLNNSGGYAISTEIYDAQLRPRQTQTTTPAGGRMITDTFYDSRGWVTETYNGWWDAERDPGTTPVYAPDLAKKVLNQTKNTYDGAGRMILAESARDNLVVSSTRTVYNGDRTTVIPPPGGTVTTAVTDPMGRATTLLEYTAAPALVSPADPFTGTFRVTGGTTTATTYGYDDRGNQAFLTDASGAEWKNQYDLLGRVTSKTDPVAGTSTTTYDGVGNITEVTDSRGKTVSYVYDKLNRKTGSFAAAEKDQSSANQFGKWEYDNTNNAVAGMTNPIGKLTTATTYRNGAAYTTQYGGFTAFGASTGETITIPATEGLLGNTYSLTHKYLAVTGKPYSDTWQAAGGLPAETVTYSYKSSLEIPNGASSLLATYANVTNYDAWGRITGGGLNASSSQATMANIYDDHTGWLKQRKITKTTTSTSDVGQRAYEYDRFGNIIKQVETRNLPGVAAETQCYRHDALRRLTSAWTATDNCATQPTAGNRSMVGSGIGSTAAFWTEWTFDAVGNRKTQIQRSLSGGSDTTTDYVYNGNGAGQPHTLTSTTTTGGLTGSTSYTYDKSGNMTARNAGQGNQTLTWDETGELTAVTGGRDGDSRFLYDADGNLLIQRDPGVTTLYLPSQQITLNTTTNTVSGVRYYPLPNGAVAIRTGSGTNYGYMVPDHQGNPTLYLNNTAQIPTWRQFTPYGGQRGATVTAPDNRGFLNQPLNTNTGLTQVGARNYDPTTGRFVSLDPLQDLASPQQWNGYAYANNSPVTMSDPSGLIPDDCSRFDCYGYSPTKGCPGGCGSEANQAWGEGRKLSGSAPKRRYDPRILGHVIRVPETVPLEEFTRRWNEQRGEFLYNSGPGPGDWTAENERILAISICAQMGRPGGCDKWIEELAEQRFGWLAANLPPDELMGGGAGALGKQLSPPGAKPGGGAGGKRGGCMMSFSGDTEVLMADGSAKALDEVRVGDEVHATDPETGEQGPRRVEHVWKHLDDLVELEIGDAVLVTTEDHPFWNRTERQWQRADELTPGDLVLAPDGAAGHVGGLRPASVHPALAFNLTVNGLHTYYVMAGGAPVLVHNDGPTPPRLVQEGIDAFNRGELRQRMTTKMENGRPVRVNGQTVQVPDEFRGDSGPIGARKFWKGAKIYEIPGGGNDYRLLVKADGTIGWVGPKGGRPGAGHNYDRITTYRPCR